MIAGSMIGHILHISLLYALYWMARKSVLIALLLGTVVSMFLGKIYETFFALARIYF